MSAKQLKSFLLNLLFPSFCLQCGQEGAVLCEDCLSAISISPNLYCPFCPLPVITSNGKCKKHENTALSGLFSACSYKEKLVKKMLVQFKYKPYLKILCHPLASLIITHIYLSENKSFFQTGENSTFMPLPIAKKKQKQRGFNQAELLASDLALFFQIPLLKNVLIKTKETKPQMELTRNERKENIKGAFAIKNPLAVLGKKVFLVDDVLTTGSTLEEAARTLKKAGASEVWGLVVAREPLGFKQ